MVNKSVLIKDYLELSNDIDLVSYLNISEEQSIQLLTERNQLRVRESMINSSEITLDDHFNFINSLEESFNKAYWVCLNKDKDIIASLSLTNIDFLNQSCEAGNFIFSDSLNKGLGFLVNYLNRLLAFEILGLKTVTSRVKFSNKSAIRLNDFFGKRIVLDNIKDEYIYFQTNYSTWNQVKTKAINLLAYMK